MMVNKTRKYHNVLSIPERHHGAYEIKHLHSGPNAFQLNNYRTMLFAGHGNDKLQYVHFDIPTKWHQLNGPTGTLMTDLPIEQYQINQLIRKIKSGSVLVGGLGLGYVATVLAHQKAIKQIVIIEKSASVIKLVEPYLLSNKRALKNKVEVIHNDLFKYLKNLSSEPTFDWAFYDIWQGDGEATLFDIVIPLLKLSDKKILNRPICWNEDVMRGQLKQSLDSRYLTVTKFKDIYRNMSIDDLCKKNGSKWIRWSADFFRWVRTQNPNDEWRNRAAAFYAAHYGEPFFEQKWANYLLYRYFLGL